MNANNRHATRTCGAQPHIKISFESNAGINLTGYHPQGLTPGPLIFSVKNPRPGDNFSVQNSGPRVEGTKLNPHPRA